MKNIHVLPTDRPSRLFIDIDNDKLTITNNPIGGEHFMNQNIYITSDEEIKEGDYCISHLNIIDEGKIYNSQTIFNPKTKEHLILLQSCKKIILTTDQDLIKDGVQAIDDEFLEWFVKNPSCEEVKIEKDTRCCGRCDGVIDLCYADMTCDIHNQRGCEECYGKRVTYKIIIPKEEPKQETLEEFTENQLSIGKYQDQESAIRHSIKLGAKWQQERMYSEEEMVEILKTFDKNFNSGIVERNKGIKKWFEQFKKK